MRSAIARRSLGPRFLASSLLAIGLAGCVSVVEIPIETPLQSKLDVARFKRLLVAGFVVEKSDVVELQAETVRLLQNHLRANGKLRVLEPDHPPIEDALAPTEKRPGAGAAVERSGREQRRAEAERVLQDAGLWRRVGEEYQQPLIISGRIGFEGKDQSGFEEEDRVPRDAGGVPYDVAGRRYAERRGFTLAADFHFIDGRTGQTLHKERFTEEVLYSEEHKVSALSAYFELMDRLLPNVLGVIATQRVRGTRVLLY
jgi:hypothetical protein